MFSSIKVFSLLKLLSKESASKISEFVPILFAPPTVLFSFGHNIASHVAETVSLISSFGLCPCCRIRVLLLLLLWRRLLLDCCCCCCW